SIRSRSLCPRNTIHHLLRKMAIFFFLIRHCPPRSTLFPYTTLFRSAFEVGFTDPLPLVPTQLGGVWSSYWYNGLMYESDITTGLRVYDLSDRVTAGARKLDHLNPQTQEIVIE